MCVVGGGGWFMKSMECCDLLSICFPNVSKDAYRLFGLLDILILRCLSSTINSVDNLHEFQCEITPYKNKLRKNWKTLLIHFEKVFVIYYSKRWFICIIYAGEKNICGCLSPVEVYASWLNFVLRNNTLRSGFTVQNTTHLLIGRSRISNEWQFF